MKHIIYLPALLLLFFLAGCKKQQFDETIKPDAVNGASSAPGSLPGTGTGGISLANTDQAVTVTIAESTLTMVYDENVTFFVAKAFMEKAYAIHLSEDFSACELHKFDYTSVTSTGASTFNWADDNLNNIGKIQKDTSINGAAVTKINVTRTFIFAHTYNNAEDAKAEYNVLLNKKESIGFTIYLAPQYTGSPTLTTKTGVAYIPGK